MLLIFTTNAYVVATGTNRLGETGFLGTKTYVLRINKKLMTVLFYAMHMLSWTYVYTKMPTVHLYAPRWNEYQSVLMEFIKYVDRISIFGVSDKARLKPISSATETT